MSSSELGLGKIIETEQGRDAIHVAIIPIVAYEDLWRGREVGLTNDGRATTQADRMIGIVDPFLKQTVEAGQKFWLFLFPNTVTSLRHEWTHPAFPQFGAPDVPPPPAPVDENRLAAERAAAICGLSYGALMDAFEQYADTSEQWPEYTHMGQNERYKRVNRLDWEKAWAHYEQENNVKVSEERFGDIPFSCSC